MKYRSPIQSLHEASGATWLARQGVVVVATPGGLAAIREHVATSVAMVDLSPLPRIAVVGRSIERWLGMNGYEASPPLNRAARQKDGVSLLRVAANEVLALSSVNAHARKQFAAGAEDHACFTVDRRASHAWYALIGDRCRAVLSKLCAHDMSASHVVDGAVVQANVAGVGAIIARLDSGGVPVFHLLVDQSYGYYLWNCVADAAAEFDGRVFGVDVFDGL